MLFTSNLSVFHRFLVTVIHFFPLISSNVSAEIYVVAMGFLAPAHLDPKFLDPKHVFSDVADPAASSSASAQIDIFHPEKAKRNRSGYEDGLTILFKTVAARTFIDAPDPIVTLAAHNQITFDGTEPFEVTMIT